MPLCRTVSDLRTTARDWRVQGQTIALVITKGDLHAGHMALVARAQTEAHRVVVVIAPRTGAPGQPTPRQDLALLTAAGVDAVFLPMPDDLFPPGAQTVVETTDLAKTLIGKQRPGHFRGVATLATTLFNIVQPDVACFGEADYQQLCVIRQMVRDLNMSVRILGVPALREGDGLVLAAANAHLTPADRDAAGLLSRVLIQADEMAQTGITVSRLRAWIAAHIQAEPRADLQSVDIRDAETLATIAGPVTAPSVILLAVKFGPVLLMDQRVIEPQGLTSIGP